MKTTAVEQQNKKMRANLIYQNYLVTAHGTLHREFISHDLYEYGFTDVSFWDPTTMSWIPVQDSSKFIASGEDYDSAFSEFWSKWRNYCLRRFNRPYIKLEQLN